MAAHYYQGAIRLATVVTQPPDALKVTLGTCRARSEYSISCTLIYRFVGRSVFAQQMVLQPGGFVGSFAPESLT